jgi:hypothetical protein
LPDAIVTPEAIGAGGAVLTVIAIVLAGLDPLALLAVTLIVPEVALYEKSIVMLLVLLIPPTNVMPVPEYVHV